MEKSSSHLAGFMVDVEGDDVALTGQFALSQHQMLCQSVGQVGFSSAAGAWKDDPAMFLEQRHVALEHGFGDQRLEDQRILRLRVHIWNERNTPSVNNSWNTKQFWQIMRTNKTFHCVNLSARCWSCHSLPQGIHRAGVQVCLLRWTGSHLQYDIPPHCLNPDPDDWPDQHAWYTPTETIRYSIQQLSTNLYKRIRMLPYVIW